MKIEIKSRWTAGILFSVEAESLKMAVEMAVKQGANLGGAYLRGANLGGARFPLQIGGHKHWLITEHDGKLRIGCHVHTFEQWIKNAEKIGKAEGYSDLDIEIYRLHIKHLQKVSQLLWNASDSKTEKVSA